MPFILFVASLSPLQQLLLYLIHALYLMAGGCIKENLWEFLLYNGSGIRLKICCCSEPNPSVFHPLVVFPDPMLEVLQL